jgi:hypothetical protein
MACLAKARVQRKVPFMQVSTIRSQSSSVMLTIGAIAAVPALLTSIWTGPNRSRASSKASSMSAAEVTLPVEKASLPPAADSSSLAASAECSGMTSRTTTSAPRASSSAAIAFPIPRPPPVTRAVDPMSSISAAYGARKMARVCSVSRYSLMLWILPSRTSKTKW